MKKIVTLVLAFVLVFGITTPAKAQTTDPAVLGLIQQLLVMVQQLQKQLDKQISLEEEAKEDRTKDRAERKEREEKEDKEEEEREEDEEVEDISYEVGGKCYTDANDQTYGAIYVDSNDKFKINLEVEGRTDWGKVPVNGKEIIIDRRVPAGEYDWEASVYDKDISNFAGSQYSLGEDSGTLTVPDCD